MATTTVTVTTKTMHAGYGPPQTQTTRAVEVLGMQQAVFNAKGVLDFAEALRSAAAPDNALVTVADSKNSNLHWLVGRWETLDDSLESS